MDWLEVSYYHHRRFYIICVLVILEGVIWNEEIESCSTTTIKPDVDLHLYKVPVGMAGVKCCPCGLYYDL